MADRPETGIVVNVTVERLKQIIELSERWNETLDETVSYIIDGYLDDIDRRHESKLK